MEKIMLQVGEDGSMEIPSELREKLGIEAGTKLVARVEGDRCYCRSKLGKYIADSSTNNPIAYNNLLHIYRPN